MDAEEMALWELKHPNTSFSAWVRECIHLDVLPDVEEDVQNSNYTLDEIIATLPPPDPATAIDRPWDELNPLEIKDREEAEFRARQIMESFGQNPKKTEENVRAFMRRWDELHPEPEV